MNDFLKYFHEIKEKDYYSSQLMAYNSNQNFRFKFNLSSLLFGGYWLIYRKMYLYGIIFSIIELLYKFAFTYIIVFNNFFFNNIIIIIPIRILLGYYSNKIYLINSYKRINSCPYDNSQNENRESWLSKEGGTDKVAVIIFILLTNISVLKELIF